MYGSFSDFVKKSNTQSPVSPVISSSGTSVVTQDKVSASEPPVSSAKAEAAGLKPPSSATISNDMAEATNTANATNVYNKEVNKKHNFYDYSEY